MGNQLAKAVTTRPAELLSDLPNVVYKDTLGGGRVLKTFVCVHDDGGLVVVKVYLKREGSPDLGSHKEELERIRDCLGGLSCPHLWPFQTWFESDNKAFLLRQYIFSNLYERISTRPFLSLPEKKWIAFQLLFALRQAHEKLMNADDTSAAEGQAAAKQGRSLDASHLQSILHKKLSDSLLGL